MHIVNKFTIILVTLMFILSCDFISSLEDLNSNYSINTLDSPLNESDLVCGDCHDYPLRDVSQIPEVEYHTECYWCHDTVLVDNTTFINIALMQNGIVDLNDQPMACMACHYPELASYLNNDHNGGDCDQCHQYHSWRTPCYSCHIWDLFHNDDTCNTCHSLLHEQNGWNLGSRYP